MNVVCIFYESYIGAVCGHTFGFSLDWNVLIFFVMYVGICLPSAFRTAAILAESERGEDWSGCYGVVELSVRKIQAMGMKLMSSWCGHLMERLACYVHYV